MESRQAANDQTREMRAGVRTTITQVRRWRGAAHGTFMATLCAGAFAPVVAALVGAGIVSTAALGVLGAVGGNVLTNVIGQAMQRLRGAQDPKSVSVEEVALDLAASLNEVLAADGQEALALRGEIAAVLKEIGAAREVIEAAVQSGDENLQSELLTSLGQLAGDFSEFTFMLEEVGATTKDIQEKLRREDDERRIDRDLNRQQAIQVRLIRDQLSSIERHIRRTALPGVASPLEHPQWRHWDQPPYRGLWPFQEEQAEVFYGRERLSAELVGRVEQCLTGRSMLVVTGASGAGKSSLLRAGLLPALDRGQLAAPGSAHWPRLVITPTASPIQELAVQLSALIGADAVTVSQELAKHPEKAHLYARQAVNTRAAQLPSAQQALTEHGRLLLIVDQFEELFTLPSPDPGARQRQRQAFFTALGSMAAAYTDKGPAAVVIIGVRADYLAQCTTEPDLVPVLQDGSFVVGPMTEQELRLVITGPAAAANLELENGLADHILAELRTASAGNSFPAGTLPLLSQAMLRTWEHSDKQRLTLRDYGEGGGIERAIQISAEEVFTTLSREQQVIAQELFRRMVTVGRDGQLIRRQLSRDELPARHPAPGPDDRADDRADNQVDDQADGRVDDTDAVLEAFAAKRLILLGSDTAEIAHDALLDAWPRLRDWLKDDQVGRALYSQVVTDAAEWDSANRDPAFLYRSTRLSTVVRARAMWEADQDRYPPLTDVSREFIDEALRHETRATRWRRASVGLLALLLIGTTISAAWAIQSSQEARHQADRAIAQRNVAASRQLVADGRNLAATDPQLSRLLAAAAWKMDQTEEARINLYAALFNPALDVLSGHADEVNAVAFSPDGKTLATAGDDRTVRLWDIATGDQIATFTGHTDWVRAVAFSPNGKTLATASDDRTVRLWRVADGELITILRGHTATVRSVAFHPDGTRLASAGKDETARLWDVATGRLLATFTGHTDYVNGVTFSPDGKMLATASGDDTARLWDVATAKSVATLSGHEDALVGVAFSPDGRMLATASNDYTARLWDVATRKTVTELIGHTDDVNAVAFSPDGRTLATTSNDKTVRLWDIAGDKEIAKFAGHTDDVNAVAFSPDGRTLATGSSDRTARLWQLTTVKPTATLIGHESYVNAVAFSPDGRMLATASHDKTAQLWDVTIGVPTTMLTGHTDEVNEVAFSPDGKMLATASNDETARLWDAATGRMIATLTGHTGEVNAVAFSPDGTMLATASADKTARLWNTATAEPVATLSAHTDAVRAVGFSPDGRMLATASADETIRLWQIPDGGQVADLTGHTNWVNEVAFSPDGTMLATASGDDTARLWDVATKKTVTEFLGHADALSGVAFDPAGQTLATAAHDETARLWDVATGRTIATFTGHTDVVRAVAFSPDGTMLATASDDHTAALWSVAEIRDPHASLCAQINRPLDEQERQKYIPDPTFQKVC